MKIIKFENYLDDNLSGWDIQVFKFRKRSIFQFQSDQSARHSLPSVLVQIGPSELFYISFGLVFFFFTFTVWGRHYCDN